MKRIPIMLPLTATLATFVPVASGQISFAQTPAKSNPVSTTQLPAMKSFSFHVPTPPYLIEAANKANSANQRGEMFLKAGYADSAISSFQEALTFDKQNRQAYLGLAQAYEAKGQLNQSVAAYRIVFYNWPGKIGGDSSETNSTYLMRFAMVLFKSGQREEALKVYQRGYHFLPTDRGPLPPLFTTPDFAAADFEAAADTAMGIYETAWGVAADAPDHFERAIATQPMMAAPYYYRGLILEGQPGRAADALADMRRAKELGDLSVKPFVDDALKAGTTEFKAEVKKSGAANP
jgi:tetratricopeptide (TPR) repeat protein